MRPTPLALVLPLAVVSLSCRSTELPPEPPRPVRVQRIGDTAVAGGLRYSASLQPIAQVVMAFKVGGYVEAVPMRSGVDGKLRPLQGGDVVRRGDELARLRQADYQHKVAEAQAQRSAAATAVERTSDDFTRAQALFKGESLSKGELDHARAALESARDQLAMADAELRTAELAHSDSVLRAPMDGVILQRSVEVGALAAPGTPGFVMADLSSVKAVFGVPEAVVSRLTVGLDLDLHLTGGAADQVARGKITAIAPAADAVSRVFPVEVTVPNPKGLVRAGAVATVEISAEGLAGAPVTSVPLSAVVRGPGGAGYAVYVVEGGKGAAVARLRKVQVGDITGNGVAVLAGVGAGDPVVISGATLLADGSPVEVLE